MTANTLLFLHRLQGRLYILFLDCIFNDVYSGKSLIYQLPVLESLLRDKSSKAMYIFPTKALAQDQMRALMDMMAQIPELEGITVSENKDRIMQLFTKI